MSKKQVLEALRTLKFCFPPLHAHYSRRRKRKEKNSEEERGRKKIQVLVVEP
jgi:hypothetical protein